MRAMETNASRHTGRTRRMRTEPHYHCPNRSTGERGSRPLVPQHASPRRALLVIVLTYHSVCSADTVARGYDACAAGYRPDQGALVGCESDLREASGLFELARDRTYTH